MKLQSRSDARWLAGGGTLLCALATLFTWQTLAISPEYVLALGAFVATAFGVTARPRRFPELGVIGLFVCAVAAAGWFAGGAYLGLVPSTMFKPMPLVAALALSLGGALASVLIQWKDVRDDEASATRMVYALVAIALLASGAIYYQLFTVGFAEDHIARRMVITLVWVAAGLALMVRARGREALLNGGRLFVAAAYTKALLYDTTHLDGMLRIAALLSTGGLLLGAAWALRRREVA